MKLKKLATVTALAAALVGFGSPAQATGVNPLPIGLALVLDESGSISNADWLLQRDAYASVLNSNLIGIDGSLVIGVWKFAAGVEQVFAPTLINSQQDKDDLVDAIEAMVRVNTGATSIGDAVNAATAGLVNFGLGGLEKAVIDVSTDGGNNNGANPTTASNNALAAGIAAVNCLGVGGNADCTWNPASSLDFAAANFADFEAILAKKIATETDQIPEPATLILMSLGLLGLSATRRKA